MNSRRRAPTRVRARQISRGPAARDPAGSAAPGGALQRSGKRSQRAGGWAPPYFGSGAGRAAGAAGGSPDGRMRRTKRAGKEQRPAEAPGHGRARERYGGKRTRGQGRRPKLRSFSDESARSVRTMPREPPAISRGPAARDPAGMPPLSARAQRQADSGARWLSRPRQIEPPGTGTRRSVSHGLRSSSAATWYACPRRTGPALFRLRRRPVG